MALAVGTKLGPYEILSPIGAGGMGEVYRARDTRLDRTVAIKFSQQQFSERFEREARAVAALNHPHLCSLYDVGPDSPFPSFCGPASRRPYKSEALSHPSPVERKRNRVECARALSYVASDFGCVVESADSFAHLEKI
jgi:serine/threonine protein kinase